MLSGTGQVHCPSDKRRFPVRITAPLLTLAGTVAGTAAAVVAYQSAAGPSATTPASSTTTETPAPVASTSWLPCEEGWKLKGDTCVRVKQKVVVVHDLPAPAAPQAQAATTRSSGGTSSRDEADDNDGTEVEHGDENEVEDSDAQEVEHEDSDHEDVGDDD
jgi:hypothetical protein